MLTLSVHSDGKWLHYLSGQYILASDKSDSVALITKLRAGRGRESCDEDYPVPSLLCCCRNTATGMLCWMRYLAT